MNRLLGVEPILSNLHFHRSKACKDYWNYTKSVIFSASVDFRHIRIITDFVRNLRLPTPSAMVFTTRNTVIIAIFQFFWEKLVWANWITKELFLTPISAIVSNNNNIYIGFFVDWLFEAFAIFLDFIILNLLASIYTGMVLYINAMTRDMKMRVDTNLTDENEAWSIYVQEVKFHNEILEWVIFSATKN